ncbi:MAG: hypothetical protein L6R40_000872 [Gallowayella cf. fulva]|nr:MAG: hypothetical protein L6R40_000872 [Xanthomendoza cf. fulva]
MRQSAPEHGSDKSAWLCSPTPFYHLLNSPRNQYIDLQPFRTTTMAPVFLPVTAILALATFVSAQSSASIFIVNADPQPLVGSVVGTVSWSTVQLPSFGLTHRLRRQESQPPTRSNVDRAPNPKNAVSPAPSPISETALQAYSTPWALKERDRNSTGAVKCAVQGTTAAVCTASGEVPSESGASSEVIDVTTTLLPNEITYTQIPITGGNTAAAQSTGAPGTPTSTGSSVKETSTMTGSTSSKTGPSLGQASPTGVTAGATSLDRWSMLALVGPAALAAILM